MGERLDALAKAAIEQPAPWLSTLAERDQQVQRDMVRAVVAYRDRWGITSTSTLGPVPADDAHRIDYERTQTTLARHRNDTAERTQEAVRRPGGRTL
ncbi:MAG: hypothetical protein Q4C81_05835 [Kocuria sp.]|nr:hypothetical protein [Kocuria sp.]